MDTLLEIAIHDRTITIPTIGELQCELTETWMIDLLMLLLPEQAGVFLDVGVNLGQTLIKLKALDPQRPYVGFEPNPACVFYVNELIKANQFVDCTLLPIGLFTEDTVLALAFIDAGMADSAGSLISNFRPHHTIQHAMWVPVFQFDSVAHLLPIDRVGWIKIDVEGAELEVVKSLARVIERDRPMILLEVLPAYEATNAARITRQLALEEILKTSGYGLFRVLKTALGDYDGLRWIEQIGIHGDLDQCDYLGVPDELTASTYRAISTAA
jgi:FkbM family methyltransferase